MERMLGLYKFSLKVDFLLSAALGFKMVSIFYDHAILIGYKNGIVFGKGLKGHCFPVSNGTHFYPIEPDALQHCHSDEARQSCKSNDTGLGQDFVRRCVTW